MDVVRSFLVIVGILPPVQRRGAAARRVRVRHRGDEGGGQVVSPAGIQNTRAGYL